MPLFEYRCEACSKRFSLLIGLTAQSEPELCPHCGSPKVARLVSRFSRGRTEDDRVDEITDRLDMMGDPDSPSQMRAMARDIGKAMDDDMSDDLEEMFESDFDDED